MPIDNQFEPYSPLISEPSLSSPSVPVPAHRSEIDPNNPPWGLGGAIGVWLASLVIQILVPVFMLIPYAFYRGVTPSNPDFRDQLLKISVDRSGILLQVLALLPTHLITFAMVWALVTRLGKFPFLQTIGWSWPPRLRFWRSVGLGALLFAGGSALAHFAGADKPTMLEQVINSSPAARYAIAFLAVLTAPFVEEFVYRGILFGAIQKLGGAIAAGVITFGLFTLIHVPQYWPNFGVLAAICFLTLALTIIRAKSGRLLPCIVIHLVFNGIQSVFLIIEPYYSKASAVPDPAPTLVFLSWLGLL